MRPHTVTEFNLISDQEMKAPKEQEKDLRALSQLSNVNVNEHCTLYVSE